MDKKYPMEMEAFTTVEFDSNPIEEAETDKNTRLQEGIDKRNIPADEKQTAATENRAFEIPDQCRPDNRSYKKVMNQQKASRRYPHRPQNKQ